MTVEVLIEAGAGEIRVALVADGKLEELSFARRVGERNSLIGDMMLGRVQRVMPGMQAAFVDVGLERAGFLALRDALTLAKKENAEIGDCVREGDAVLVQAIKDPIGEKGTRLSASVSLPGHLLVMMPGQNGLMFSRHIAEAQRRSLAGLGEDFLARVGEGAGYIFRTAALGASLDALVEDAMRLKEAWQAIEQKRKTAKIPSLLHHDLGPVERALRDYVRGPVARVAIDDAALAEEARRYCRRAMPEAERLVELVEGPVLAEWEDEIAALSLPKIELSSGGWITIEATEGMTAIDVNSGRFAGGGLEETSHAVNLEAAREIGRQIRLRGIGGLIVVDFIHLTHAGHVAEILAALEESLSFDGAPVMISAMNEFGIVAITRKRVRESFAQLTGVCCPNCRGAGRVASAESAAMAVLRRVEREARAAPGREVVAEVPAEVAEWFQAHREEITPNLARRGAGRVRFVEGIFPSGGFDVRAV
jgi:ribonuclease G